MEEVDYKRVREVMWTDKRYQLRELPDFYGFPLLIKVTKGASDAGQKQTFSKGEVLRVDGEEKQRRMIASDAKGRHWSFPVHIGAKFDVPSKKGSRLSVYMSDIVESEKLPKKFTFAQKDEMQIKITGEDPSKVGPLIEGDFKTREVTRVRIFKANRITDDEIDPTVVFLPAYLDLEVSIATKLACEEESLWEDYMDAMTRDISKMVNLNMYRGKSDIQIYDISEKMVKKSKRNSASLYEEVAPVKIVTIRSIINRRTPSTKSKKPVDDEKSLCSNYSNPNMTTFSSSGGAEAEKEEPQRAVVDILRDLQDKDEAEMTEEEIRMAKHRRKMLAFLAQDEEEERRKSQLLEEEGGGREVDDADGAAADDGGDDNDDDGDGGDGDDDVAGAAKARGEGDGGDIEETGGTMTTPGISAEDEQMSQEEVPSSAPNRPRSPGDGSTVTEDSVFVDESSKVVQQKIPPKPRIPTRPSPGLRYPQDPASPKLDATRTEQDHSAVPNAQSPNPNLQKERPPPPPKPKPAVPANKPAVPANKPAVPANKPAAPANKPVLRPPIVPRVHNKVSQVHVADATNPSRFASMKDYPEDLRGVSIDDMC